MTYSTPVLSGSIPNPATQPLQGVLTWTESDAPLVDACSLLLHDGTTDLRHSGLFWQLGNSHSNLGATRIHWRP